MCDVNVQIKTEKLVSKMLFSGCILEKKKHMLNVYYLLKLEQTAKMQFIYLSLGVWTSFVNIILCPSLSTSLKMAFDSAASDTPTNPWQKPSILCFSPRKHISPGLRNQSEFQRLWWHGGMFISSQEHDGRQWWITFWSIWRHNSRAQGSWPLVRPALV